MLDGAPANALLLLGGVVCLTIAAWLAMRRDAPRSDVYRRLFCANCGFDVAARLAGRRSMSMPRPAPAESATTQPAILPSELLSRGWSRTVQPAADAAGLAVFSDSRDARYFTIWSAANRCFVPGSCRWGSFYRNLQAVLQERYGNGVQIQKWNRVAVNQDAVVSVAQEAERRMRQHGE